VIGPFSALIRRRWPRDRRTIDRNRQGGWTACYLVSIGPADLTPVPDCRHSENR
jgi:hypothetical protein